MNKLLTLTLGMTLCVGMVQAKEHRSASEFDPSKGVSGTVTLPTGEVVDRTATNDSLLIL